MQKILTLLFLSLNSIIFSQQLSDNFTGFYAIEMDKEDTIGFYRVDNVLCLKKDYNYAVYNSKDEIVQYVKNKDFFEKFYSSYEVVSRDALLRYYVLYFSKEIQEKLMEDYGITYTNNYKVWDDYEKEFVNQQKVPITCFAEYYIKNARQFAYEKKYIDAIKQLTYAEANTDRCSNYYSNSRIYSLKAEYKFSLNDYRGSILDDKKAIEYLEKENDYISDLLISDCLSQIGASYFHINDFQNALIYLNKSNANNSFTHLYRGATLLNLGDIEKGCLELSKAGEMGSEEAYRIIREGCQ